MNAAVYSSSVPASPAQARALQDRLRRQVVTRDRRGPVRIVAGIDAHYAERQGLTWAAIAAVRYPELELVESVLACRPTEFPYIPGLLSFREAPAMLDALQRLSHRPDLLLIDGQGIAHPRRFGLACHVGTLADLPAIGVAKSRLTGVHDDPGQERGSWTPLMHRGDEVGAVLRTRDGVRPVFVSIGHRISLPTAIEWVGRCAPCYRLPEPLRMADRLSRAHRDG